ncbi:LysR family transcriptional regulator [Luteimonas fraxinea]|uniref:LysR family transcriptional regulator n=1 Tax=Luteimonas fraxinea TaxID=2901869 RepID=A0ABS8UA82_9GAMM|nr:LysR family transcriptional regulator [Luteimonas fraxinea]MCD9095656.1 LysR family transcriptional regulator [Luteimonas fraxinea]MCD9124238.1 LysR family transcriptional regulator [Luteimonas fraxinea]UHH11152.1 LysR family transcriptional regulator [Luteimonas fraxinea]
MNQMIDPRLLRAFIAVIDGGGFTRAAEHLNMTQSTISQQIARLEDQLGQPLIDRDARPARMTVAGERLSGYARRILALQDEATLALGDRSGTVPVRIGLADDILTLEMAGLFATFAAAHRHIRLDVTTGLSRGLTARYRDGEFDIIVVKESAPAPDCRVSFPEPIAWFETTAAGTWPDPLPLVTFPPGGLYREQMFARAEADGRRWYVAFSGSSLQNVTTAVEAGLGISLLPVRAATGHRMRRCRLFGSEQAMVVSLYAWETQGPYGPLVAAMHDVLDSR